MLLNSFFKYRPAIGETGIAELVGGVIDFAAKTGQKIRNLDERTQKIAIVIFTALIFFGYALKREEQGAILRFVALLFVCSTPLFVLDILSNNDHA